MTWMSRVKVKLFPLYPMRLGMISPLLYLFVLFHPIGIVSVLLDTFLFFFIELLVLYYAAEITIPGLTCKCSFF